jgi:regulator of nucleoside diphosphate kinase
MREETVSEDRVRLTDIDTRRLQSLVEGFRSVALKDAASLALLERQVEQAEVLPARGIDPDVVTIDSEVLVRDLDTHQTTVFRVVFPGMADTAARRISVLAPLGMAVLGRHSGDHVTCQTPGGSRRLLVDRVLYQPEREGRDVAALVGILTRRATSSANTRRRRKPTRGHRSRH